MAHAGGRPTIYDEKKTCAAALKYLEGCVDEDHVRVKSEGGQTTSFDNSVKVRLPSIEGLSIYLNITRQMVYEWKEAHGEFGDIVNKILAEQAERLLNNGLSGTYNASIAKLILTKHGYVDRVDGTTNGKDLPTPILGNIIKSDEVQRD